MGYAAGEAAILTLIRNATEFDSSNSVSVANNNPAGYLHWLDKGTAREYCFIRPGAFTTEMVGVRTERTAWTTHVQVWVRFKETGESDARRVTMMQAVKDEINSCQTLGGIAYSARVTGGDEPQDMVSQDGRSMWLVWDVTVTWQEDVEL